MTIVTCFVSVPYERGHYIIGAQAYICCSYCFVGRCILYGNNLVHVPQNFCFRISCVRMTLYFLLLDDREMSWLVVLE